MKRTIPTEPVACDLCGAEDQDLLYTRLDPVTGQEFHLVECRCGMAFVNPMPVDHAIPALYPSDYLKDKHGMTSLYRGMLKFLPRGGGKLLDIGCGRGDFIRYASGHGWQVEGIDLLAWDTPEDVPIRVGDFTRMALPERHYDVITAWAILEHVKRPSLFFEKASALLKDSGRFVFLVPNFSAPGMRWSCTEDVPRHLHLFTPKAVRAYLHRFGMEAEAIHHSSSLYTAYPFGLLRHCALRIRGRETRCQRYENRSVVLLRNRQINGNLKTWLREVVESVGPVDLFLDTLDLLLGITVATISRALGNYGVITVIARPWGQKKSNPDEEDC